MFFAVTLDMEWPICWKTETSALGFAPSFFSFLIWPCVSGERWRWPAVSTRCGWTASVWSSASGGMPWRPPSAAFWWDWRLSAANWPMPSRASYAVSTYRTTGWCAGIITASSIGTCVLFSMYLYIDSNMCWHVILLFCQTSIWLILRMFTLYSWPTVFFFGGGEQLLLKLFHWNVALSSIIPWVAAFLDIRLMTFCEIHMVLITIDACIRLPCLNNAGPCDSDLKHFTEHRESHVRKYLCSWNIGGRSGVLVKQLRAECEARNEILP